MQRYQLGARTPAARSTSFPRFLRRRRSWLRPRGTRLLTTGCTRRCEAARLLPPRLLVAAPSLWMNPRGRSRSGRSATRHRARLVRSRSKPLCRLRGLTNVARARGVRAAHVRRSSAQLLLQRVHAHGAPAARRVRKLLLERGIHPLPLPVLQARPRVCGRRQPGAAAAGTI